MVLHVDFTYCILLLPRFSLLVTENKKLQEGTRNIIHTNWICVCVCTRECKPTYIQSFLYMCVQVCVHSDYLCFLWRGKLCGGFILWSEIYVHSALGLLDLPAWIFPISDLNNGLLKEETISLFINQNQMALKVTLRKQWQESNACNWGRKPRTVN